MRVNRGRSSGAGRVARRSFAGWALVAQARQGGELAPCGHSDSAALPPRLRSSHPAKFALGHAPDARPLPKCCRGNRCVGWACSTSPRVWPESDQWTTSPRACPEIGRGRGPVDDPSARMSGIRARARTSDRLVCMAGKNQPTIRICSRPVPVWSAWLIRTVPDSDARFWCTVALRDTDAQRGPSLIRMDEKLGPSPILVGC